MSEEITIEQREDELKKKALESTRARLIAEKKLRPEEIEVEVKRTEIFLDHKRKRLKEFQNDPYHQRLMAQWREAHDKVKKPYPIFWNDKLDKYVWVSRKIRRIP